MTAVRGEQNQPVQLPIKLKEKIDLTKKEREIFDRLLGTLRHCKPDTQHTELRVAGGWVRDKLLGKDSDDIDIAINNMSGSEFLDKVKEYLASINEQVQGGTVIERNPDQSKHLETARMRLCDQWIDFVNLRCEEYTAESRIPTMKFGTAKEDALRRDFTINSLFYNIKTESVEDLTEQGIKDLEYQRIVTPLPAKDTFRDDPLRVLRAIRFGARFGFNLDENLIKAVYQEEKKEDASSKEVREALGKKISRERIGNEIDLMISGNGPFAAVRNLSDLKLFEIVFATPSSCEPAPSENCSSVCKAYLKAMSNLIQTPEPGKFSGEQRRLGLYAALFLPFRKTVYKDNKGKSVPVVNHILKFSLKRKTSDAETVINIHRTTERFLSLISPLQSKNDVELDKLDWATDVLEHWKSISLDDPKIPAISKIRVLTGFLLRDIKDLWRVTLLTSLLLSTVDGVNEDQEIGHLDFEVDKIQEIYLRIVDTIQELGLDNIWDVKPLVNGRDIMEIAELRGGYLIREWQQKVLTWQLAYPSGSAEECKNWMRQVKAKRQKIEERL